MEETQQKQEKKKDYGKLYDKYYWIIGLIPVIIMIASLVLLFTFFRSHNDIILKDPSLSGGTTITLQSNGNIDSSKLETQLKQQFSDISVRKLTDLRTGEVNAITIESSAKPEDLRPAIEKIIGFQLTDKNSSVEFTGPTLSSNFYKQLIFALIVSFILMSIVIFFLFRTFVPSVAVIFAAFSDIVMPLAIVDFYGIKLSAAGIAAFLMLIGYSVDTDILLTTRCLKNKHETLNMRIYGAFKTGIFMSITAICAVIPAFFIFSGLPDSFRQIFLILGLGLGADIINTWLTNAMILKFYCSRREDLR